jgi:hypothetical protein
LFPHLHLDMNKYFPNILVYNYCNGLLFRLMFRCSNKTIQGKNTNYTSFHLMFCSREGVSYSYA